LESFEDENRFDLGLQKDRKSFECREELSQSSFSINKKCKLQFGSTLKPKHSSADEEEKVIASIIEDTSSVHGDSFGKRKVSSSSSHESEL